MRPTVDVASKNTAQGAAQLVRVALTVSVIEPTQPLVSYRQLGAQDSAPLSKPSEVQLPPLSLPDSQSSPGSSLPFPQVALIPGDPPAPELEALFWLAQDTAMPPAATSAQNFIEPSR